MVIPEPVGEGEGMEAFMCRIAVEWVCHVTGADGVEVFGDRNVRGDVVEEGVALVIRPTRKGVRKVCLPRSPLDGVFITPYFFYPT
jgi:hypothetical protein